MAEEDSISVMSLRNPVSVCDLGKDYVALHHVFGADISRRNNISLIENHRLVYALGNVVVFEDIATGNKEYLLSIDEGGVGCVAVHPSRCDHELLVVFLFDCNTRKYFAVGCKGVQPSIYVYKYPSMKVLCIAIL